MQINPDQISFTAFKDGLAQGVTFLKRRFSSGDLMEDNENPQGESPQQQPSPQAQQDQSSLQPPPRPNPPRRQTVDMSAVPYVATTVRTTNALLHLYRIGFNKTICAAHKNPGSVITCNFHRVMHFMNERAKQPVAQQHNECLPAPTSPANKLPQQSSVSSRNKNVVSSSGSSPKPALLSYNVDRCKCLLIIDNSNIDWQKYFIGQKLQGDWDVRVEQTNFQSIKTVSSNAEGCFVHFSDTKILKLDFVLIRQHAKDKENDFRNILIGLMYGGVPSVNTLQSIYNFSDRSFVFSHLLTLTRKLGFEKFPLIHQTFTLGSDKLTFSAPIQYPVVVKAGHAFHGVGKMKIQTPPDLLDFDSVLNLHNDYATVEPYIDVACEITIRKIGAQYKTILGKRKSDYWKSTCNSLLAEPTATEEKYKRWIDEVCHVFGGLDVCSLSVLAASDGQEYIYKVNDVTLPLIGDFQDDVQRIAELVYHKMNYVVSLGRKSSVQQADSVGTVGTVGQNQVSPASQVVDNNSDAQDTTNKVKERRSHSQAKPTVPAPPIPIRRYSSVTDSSSERKTPPAGGVSGVGRKLSDVPIKEEPADDTMGNLKKTFAGLFGDM